MLIGILIIKGVIYMVSLVEQLYRGTLDFNRVNFDFKHFEDRSRQRKLPKTFVKNLIFNEKMLSTGNLEVIRMVMNCFTKLLIL